LKDRNIKRYRMKNWYKGLENRYADFPEPIQILNLASDLEKAKNFWKTDKTTAKNHLYRAIILIDYIAKDSRWRGKLRELLRLREVIGSLIESSQPLATLKDTVKAALLLNSQAYSRLNQLGRKNV